MDTPAKVAFDSREFRSALGTFATGVTVVTSRSSSGEPVGLTANSFNSVSLDPPLVLWSLARNARSLPVFANASHWAVHILAADQEALSNRFASRGEDKFAGLELESGIDDTPLLRGCAARFQCRTAFQYEGGDHIIFVGEVVAFDHSGLQPLVFHGGRYAFATQKLPSAAAPRTPALAGSFSEDFLGYLLGRAHFQFYRRLRRPLASAGISDDQHFVLATLTVADGLNALQLSASISYFLDGDLTKALDGLIARGFVTATTSAGEAHYFLTTQGRDFALQLIAAAKSFESQIFDRFGYADSTALKTLLRRLIALTDPGLADMWSVPDEGD
jgi:3-hydroxy-9,10-secoandrosta-1,3,5(10)-triene-9,17-dione monooxygenase reductase component